MRSPTVREPAVAGRFYPSDAIVLRDQVDALLASAAPATTGDPKALVVPHAGYEYSGAVAATAYSLAARMRDTITRVVIIGPTHRVAVRGIALAGVGAFATPLGALEVPEELVESELSALTTVHVSPEAHRWEHSVEVQLPFIQRALGDVEVVPLLAGDATGDEVAAVLDALWGGPETLIVISTDLSHYLPDNVARRVDAMTIARIIALDGPIDHEHACGATPLNGLMIAARRHGLRPTLLDARNSSDTAGDPDRVVGYCAVAFETPAPAPESTLPPEAGEVLIPLARAAIKEALGGEPTHPRDTPEWLFEPGASFVTLTKGGALRGCIGSLEAGRPLIDDVRANAVAAALRDPRFPPLDATELERVTVEVSVLSPPSPLNVDGFAGAYGTLRPGVDGVILRVDARHSATFLPQVWEELPHPADFLSQLWLKAGVEPGVWHEGTRLHTYTVRAWRERPRRLDSW